MGPRQGREDICSVCQTESTMLPMRDHGRGEQREGEGEGGMLVSQGGSIQARGIRKGV